MRSDDKITVTETAKLAVGPGRTEAQSKSRWKNWVATGIIPSDESKPAPGGKAYIYPQWSGAIFALLCDLFDSGIVTQRKKLAEMWLYFAEPHAEGVHPHITHVLDAVAMGEACWLILTLWRDRETAAFAITCSTRFESTADQPIAGPSPSHEPVGEHIVQLHRLLESFTARQTNVLNLVRDVG